ncbi:hypothetical protein Tco_0866930 [Tanacetum coccineum]
MLFVRDYDAFYLDDDHMKEKNSCSTYSGSDLYIRSSPVNLTLHHIPPDYDHFCFMIEPRAGAIYYGLCVEDIFPTREPRVHVPNIFPTHPTLNLDLDFIFSSDSLLAYIVWIFLPFLTYPVAPISSLLQDCPDSEASRAHGLSFDHKNFKSSASFGNPIS